MNTQTIRPKEQLIGTLQEYAEQLSPTGFSDQLNNVVINNTIAAVKTLNQLQCCKVIREIAHAEKYDPAKDKYNFGPIKISPLNYSAIIERVTGVVTEEISDYPNYFD